MEQKTMSNFDKVVEYAKNKGFNKNSKIINITHIDLDGIVSTINLKNYVSSPDNVFFVQKNYNDINQYVKNVLMAENCMHKDQDFILVTDISVNEEIVEYYLKKDCKPYLIVLDHHQTAVQLNKFANCCVDESAVKSGADVVLDFIKAMGFKETYLDSLNKYATQWDLFTFKTEEYRKFNIEGKKKAIAEMLNTLYFDQTDTKMFIERWFKGFGKGFNLQEIEILKNDQKRANEHINSLDEVAFEIDDGIMFVNSKLFMNNVCEHYFDQGKEIVMIYTEDKGKFSIRACDDSNANIGKILQLLSDSKIIQNGGGHIKAGGCNLSNSDELERFLNKFVKLINFYREKKNK